MSTNYSGTDSDDNILIEVDDNGIISIDGVVYEDLNSINLQAGDDTAEISIGDLASLNDKLQINFSGESTQGDTLVITIDHTYDNPDQMGLDLQAIIDEIYKAKAELLDMTKASEMISDFSTTYGLDLSYLKATNVENIQVVVAPPPVPDFLAVAYQDVDVADGGYNHGTDLLLFAVLDANGDDTLSAGDIYQHGPYRLATNDPFGTAVDTGTVNEYTIASGAVLNSELNFTLESDSSWGTEIDVVISDAVFGHGLQIKSGQFEDFMAQIADYFLLNTDNVVLFDPYQEAAVIPAPFQLWSEEVQVGYFQDTPSSGDDAFFDVDIFIS